LVACIPLALRYHRGGQMSEATLGAKGEVPDAEPGAVVDLTPLASVNAGFDADHAQIRRAGSA
jgi:hypothetical protein